MWYSILDSPKDYLQPELASCIDETIALAWKRMTDERRQFLELLSRIDLTQEQAKALATEEERHALGISGEDSDFISNPYLIYEATRLTSTPVSINSVDRGLLPALVVREKFPAPEPSRVNTPVDSRGLRALSIRELEAAADQGNTLLPRRDIVETLRSDEQSDDNRRTLVTGDLFGVAESKNFAGEIRVVEMSNGDPAYQLERLGAAGDLIRKTVKRRASGRRHGLAADWRAELDEYLDNVLDSTSPADEIEAREEDRARAEKAAALEEIANSRLSVLIGPAGTGKTTLLSVLCKHRDIAAGGTVLLAPTGKARVRMEEVVRSQRHDGVKAHTLAQFLIRSGRYCETRGYVLTGGHGEKVGRTVIVDECSMLTEEMLAALIESLAGVDRLILVGDPRQLPPIGAGRPFVDIVNYLKPDEFASGAPRISPSYAELTVPRRQDVQDRDGLELAEWFGGEPGPSHDSAFEILSGHRESETVEVVHWDSPDDLKDRLPQVMAKHLGFDEGQDETLEFSRSLGGQISGGYAYFNVHRSGEKAEAWQILSPSRQKPWGVETLNRLIHQRYKSKVLESATEVPRYRKRRFLKPQGNQLIVYGDKIINNRNWQVPKSRRWPSEEGYLANGEVGIVVGQMRTKRFDYPPRHLEVEFSTQPNLVVKFFPSDFDVDHEASLELAYALTIHKAQGSEFGTVFVILPRSSHMLSRELVYTALSRQKEKIVILMQGTPSDLQRLSSDSNSDVAGRITNLFSPPSLAMVGERYLEEGLIHRTARGEAVRSKSEVIIANLLNDRGIDYRYEEPLEIDGLIKFPDFTIEDDDTGERYYWEHLGLLGDEVYRRRWEGKVDWFRSNGILPREEGGGPAGTLVTTQDSVAGGIDSENISQLVGELFPLL